MGEAFQPGFIGDFRTDTVPEIVEQFGLDVALGDGSDALRTVRVVYRDPYAASPMGVEVANENATAYVLNRDAAGIKRGWMLHVPGVPGPLEVIGIEPRPSLGAIMLVLGQP